MTKPATQSPAIRLRALGQESGSKPIAGMIAGAQTTSSQAITGTAPVGQQRHQVEDADGAVGVELGWPEDSRLDRPGI